RRAALYGFFSEMPVQSSPMDERDPDAPDQADGDPELVPFAQGAIPYIKELVQKCLGAGIHAEAGAEPCTRPSCSPRAQLLVRPGDVRAVAQLLQQDWLDMVAREGTVGAMSAPVQVADAGGEPPCPA